MLSPYRRHLSNYSNVIVTLHSATNFFVYCAFSRRFRHGLARHFSCQSNTPGSGSGLGDDRARRLRHERRCCSASAAAVCRSVRGHYRRGRATSRSERSKFRLDSTTDEGRVSIRAFTRSSSCTVATTTTTATTRVSLSGTERIPSAQRRGVVVTLQSSIADGRRSKSDQGDRCTEDTSNRRVGTKSENRTQSNDYD